MIILKKMKWSNWFSYGNGNEIDFEKDTVTQILGVNGSGKSSISLILEEILYGKNSKGAKKQDIPNRETEDKTLYGEVILEVDGIVYTVILNRKSSIKLTLLRDGIDISEHTSTGTYKLIEKIIGLDFKTFSQLIYQSSKDSLQFLTATDSQRKNFLISLFNLDKYVRIHNITKDVYKEISKVYANLEGSCNTLQKWIDKHESIPLVEQVIQPDIESPDSEIKEISIIESKIASIDSENKKRTTNNEYKNMLANINIDDLANAVEMPTGGQELLVQKRMSESEVTKDKKELSDLKTLKDSICSKCRQPVDIKLKNEMIDQHLSSIEKHTAIINELNARIDKLKKENIIYKKHVAATEEFEKLSLLIDNSIPEEMLYEEDLLENISKLKSKVNTIKKQITERIDNNRKASEHNSKIKVISSQLQEYKEQLEKEYEELLDVEDLLTSLDILRKSFSTTGLVSYKIEFLVKDLENEINKYLQDFSDGRFLFNFILKGEKLNIEITDNGNSIDISLLSSGELARVNVSTLLAIRKMMSNISKAKINILFLDEILGVLDAFGKDKLIEVLLSEVDLNTFIVSHEYSHPLLNKLIAIKEKKISRLEHG